jgi:hypothetical protein
MGLLLKGLVKEHNKRGGIISPQKPETYLKNKPLLDASKEVQ